MTQHRDSVADRRQRIAKFVREHGDEAVLLAIGIAQQLVGALAFA